MASPTTYLPAVGILRKTDNLVETVEHTTEAAVIGRRGVKGRNQAHKQGCSRRSEPSTPTKPRREGC